MITDFLIKYYQDNAFKKGKAPYEHYELLDDMVQMLTKNLQNEIKKNPQQTKILEKQHINIWVFICNKLNKLENIPIILDPAYFKLKYNEKRF
jgi:hypothetical protein